MSMHVGVARVLRGMSLHIDAAAVGGDAPGISRSAPGASCNQTDVT